MAAPSDDPRPPADAEPDDAVTGAGAGEADDATPDDLGLGGDDGGWASDASI